MELPKSFKKKWFTRDKDLETSDVICIWDTRPTLNNNIWRGKKQYDKISIKLFKVLFGHTIEQGEMVKFRDKPGFGCILTNY